MHKKIMIALLGSAVLMVGGQASAQTLGNAIDSVLQQPNDRERNRDGRRYDHDSRHDRDSRHHRDARRDHPDDRKYHDERRRKDHPHDDGHPGKAKGHYKDKAQGRAMGHDR